MITLWSVGADVLMLQARMAAAGRYPFRADGICGPLTWAAVSIVRSDLGLSDDRSADEVSALLATGGPRRAVEDGQDSTAGLDQRVASAVLGLQAGGWLRGRCSASDDVIAALGGYGMPGVVLRPLWLRIAGGAAATMYVVRGSMLAAWEDVEADAAAAAAAHGCRVLAPWVVGR